MKNDKDPLDINLLATDNPSPDKMRTPKFKATGIEINAPFSTTAGIVIDDSNYAADYPLPEAGVKNTNVDVTADNRLRHPKTDIGWNTPEK